MLLDGEVKDCLTEKNCNLVLWYSRQTGLRWGGIEAVDTPIAPVLESQAEAIVDLGRTWPQHRIDIH